MRVTLGCAGVQGASGTVELTGMPTSYRRGVASVFSSLATPVLASAPGADPVDAHAAVQTVWVRNNFFSPTFTSIRRGRVVTWAWSGGRRLM
jgi:plastocyanin